MPKPKRNSGGVCYFDVGEPGPGSCAVIANLSLHIAHDVAARSLGLVPPGLWEGTATNTGREMQHGSCTTQVTIQLPAFRRDKHEEQK